MVVQLDSLTSRSIFPFGQWRQQPRRAPQQDEHSTQIDVKNICAALRRARPEFEIGSGAGARQGPSLAPVVSSSLVAKQRNTMTQPSLSPTPPRSKSSTNLRANQPPPQPRRSSQPASPSLLTSSLSALTFVTLELPEPLTPIVLPFRPHYKSKPPSPRPKRVRPLSDTDGPLTSTLPSKKRRLRRDLITSRLSQPFSQPATHILNRDGPASDKRFAKLATLINGGRLQHPPPTLRRVAMRNRLRLRVEDDAKQRGDRAVPVVAWNVIMGLRTGEGFGGFRGEARRVLSPPSSPEGPGRPKRVGDGLGHGGPGKMWPMLPGARVPLPPSSLSPARTTERQRQKTPEPTDSPRPRPVEDHEDDDEGCAFPGSGMWETALGDDVYSDFGAMFGGGSGSDGEGDSDGEIEENYEDYMDELDGIPFNAR